MSFYFHIFFHFDQNVGLCPVVHAVVSDSHCKLTRNNEICRLAVCLSRLDDFAEKTKDIVTVGRTHYQTASLVTVGKRAVMWAQELLMVFRKVD